MILDKITCLDRYEALVPGLNKAMQEIRGLSSYEVGKYPVENGYYMVQKGTTKPCEAGSFETHRKYVDVQIMIEGQEVLEWNTKAEMEDIEPYNEEKDVQHCQGKGNRILIKAGMCHILFPEDAHKACLHIDEPNDYVKIVLKLALNPD